MATMSHVSSCVMHLSILNPLYDMIHIYASDTESKTPTGAALLCKGRPVWCRSDTAESAGEAEAASATPRTGAGAVGNVTKGIVDEEDAIGGKDARDRAAGDKAAGDKAADGITAGGKAPGGTDEGGKTAAAIGACGLREH